MKIKMLPFIYFTLFLISCNPISSIYGIKPSISEKACNKFITQIDTDKEIINIDINSYEHFLKNEIDTVHIKYFYQPLQVLTFVNGSLFAHSVNCNVGGFPNLEWNFEVEDECKLLGNAINFPKIEINDYLFNINNNLPKTKRTEDIVIIVHVNCMMGRQSLRLIAAIEDLNLQCKVLYINNSAFFLNKSI